MKRTTFVLRLSLILLVCLGAVAAVSPASGAGNRCTDRCADVYRLKKDACKLIPYKHERHRCEDAAKRAKNECKRRCR
jgi:hypothetical protein